MDSVLTRKFRPGGGRNEALLVVENARKLRIRSSTAMYMESDALHLEGLPIVMSGADFKFEVEEGKSLVYHVSTITLKTPNNAEVLDERRTKTSIFMLPALKLSREELGYDTWLFNARMPKPGHSKGVLVLRYRYFPTDAYRAFEANLRKLPQFVDAVDKGGFVDFRMMYPEEFEYDLPLLLNGKYSILSPGLKTRILEFHKPQYRKELKGILYKEEAYRKKLSKDLGYEISREAELFDIPTLHEELVA